MMTRKIVSAALALALGFSAATPASAGESSSAWGTMGNPGASRSLASAQLHNTEGSNAQTATIGNAVTTMYRSISSCGNCVYNQITGDQNSINGNTISSTNTGKTTSTGTFGGN
ncbi:MAG: hypothetical protein RIS94_3130 [Pseudomonadota bacterium]|jgi:hypothetical protein